MRIQPSGGGGAGRPCGGAWAHTAGDGFLLALPSTSGGVCDCGGDLPGQVRANAVAASWQLTGADLAEVDVILKTRDRSGQGEAYKMRTESVLPTEAGLRNSSLRDREIGRRFAVLNPLVIWQCKAETAIMQNAVWQPVKM